jgi:hypothetical protein
MLAPSRTALLAVLLVGSGATCGWSQIAGDSDMVGDYRRVGPAIVTLRVFAAQGGVEVELAGGGPPASTGAVPADCTVRAAGQLHGWLLNAVFQPIETEESSYSAAQARSENRHLVIAFIPPGTADVRRADTDGYCGLGVEFQGLYRKTH